MPKGLYWNEILGLSQLSEPCQKAIDLLRAGQYKTAGLEQLAGHKVFSVRVNDADRLLFTTIKKDGQTFLLFLDYVKSHDYHKSRFLKPSVLRQHLQKNATAIEGEINELHFTPCEASDELKATQTNQPLELTPVEYYHSSFVTLTDAQNQVITSPLPLVISGGPGAGKTLVAHRLIADQINQASLDDDEPKHIIYLTESAPLANEQADEWRHHPLATHTAARGVEFMTYHQFLTRTHANQRSELTAVDDTHLQACLLESIKLYKKQRQINKVDVIVSDTFLDKTKTILEECRIASGYTEAEYLSLGKKQSLLSDNTERRWVYKFYTKFTNTKNQYHPAFFPSTATALYDFIVVDEAQDLSPRQILNCRRAAKHDAIVFCTDSRQNLKHSLSSRPFMLDLRTETGALIHHHTLPMTLRCTKAVTQVLNAALSVGTLLNEGKLDQHDYLGLTSGITHHDGQARLIDLKELNKLDALAVQTANSRHMAVITTESLVNEAKNKFKTALVFTVDQIKGLQYRDVIIYRMLSKKAWVAANRDYKNVLQSGKAYVNRPKNNDHTNEHATLCAELCTAISRAEDNLILVESTDNSHITAVLDTLKSGLVKYTAAAPQPPLESPTEMVDWEAEAKRLEAHGLTQHAALIRDTKLKPQASMPAPKTKPKKTKKKTAPVENPLHALVSAVFNTKAPAQLLDCLNHPKFLTLFYDIPVNGSSLISLVFNNETLSEAMILYFNISKNTKHLHHCLAIAARFSLHTMPQQENPQNPTNLLWYMDAKYRGALCIALMLCNPFPQQQYLEKYRKHLWAIRYPSKLLGMPASLAMLLVYSHIANLQTLIASKMLNITHTAASDWHSFIGDDVKKTSLMNIMVRNYQTTPKFVEVFFQFITAHDYWLIKESPVTAWSDRHPYSTLDYLTEFKEGIGILMILQSINPLIFSTLPPDFLFTAPEREVDRPQRTTPVSPFFRLISTDAGQTYLADDLTKNQHHYRGMSVSALTTPWDNSETAQKNRCTNALGALARTATGTTILGQIQHAFPDVFKAIPNEAWFAINTTPPNTVVNDTTQILKHCTPTPDALVHRLFQQVNDPDTLAQCLMAFDRARLFFDVKVNGHTLMMRVFCNSTLLETFTHFMVIAPQGVGAAEELGPLLNLNQILKFPGKENMTMLQWLMMDENRRKALGFLTGITQTSPSVSSQGLFASPPPSAKGESPAPGLKH